MTRETPDMTRDHIPPKSFFPKPRPTNLITVPCCTECHRKFTQDDEYLRNLLISIDGNERHPAAEMLQDKGKRSLSDSNANGYAQIKFRIAYPGLMRYAHGMTAPGATKVLDDQRIEDVLERMTVGLFWKENDKHLPSDYEIEIVGSYYPRFSDWPVQETIRRLLHEEEPVNIGDGVFQYWWLWAEDAPPGETHRSDWMFQFYEGTTFLCRIARSEESVNPSLQRPFALSDYFHN